MVSWGAMGIEMNAGALGPAVSSSSEMGASGRGALGGFPLPDGSSCRVRALPISPNCSPACDRAQAPVSR